MNYFGELALLAVIYLQLRGINHELKKVRKILQYGVRIFPVASRVVFINAAGEKVQKMNVQDSGQIVQLLLQGEDAAENPAPLDAAAAPVFSLDDPSMGSIVPAAADGSAPAFFQPSGKLGPVNVSVSIPAVNAEPALASVSPLNIQVVAGAAVSVSLSGAVAAAPAPAAPAAPSA